MLEETEGEEGAADGGLSSVASEIIRVQCINEPCQVLEDVGWLR